MDSMNSRPWYKGKTFWILVVIVVIGGYFVFGGSSNTQAPATNENNNNTTSGQTVTVEPKAGEIAVEGKFSCLPLKSGATPSSENCVLGIAGNDGKFYAIDAQKIESTDPSINAQSSVRAVGTFVAASGSSEAGDLKYDGVLYVRAMKAI